MKRFLPALLIIACFSCKKDEAPERSSQCSVKFQAIANTFIEDTVQLYVEYAVNGDKIRALKLNNDHWAFDTAVANGSTVSMKAYAFDLVRDTIFERETNMVIYIGQDNFSAPSWGADYEIEVPVNCF